MKIQRFKGRTAQEALAQARLSLGPEALILQTRRVQAPGLQGLISRPLVEVLAAVDTPARPGAHRSGVQGFGRSGVQKPVAPAYGQSGYPDDLETSDFDPAESEHLNARTPDRLSESWQTELTALRQEVASLRALLQVEGRRMRDEGRGVGMDCTNDPDPSSLIPHPSSLRLDELAQRLKDSLVTRPIEIREGECTVVALVGPTGVGKTTTLAKLAAVASRVEHKRVAFISTDTYRIGAIEQLQTYAQLLEIPMSVGYCREDVKAARERYVNYDLVLMDTVGRAPGNRQQLEELAALLEGARPNEVHLTLDARGSYATQGSVLRGFRPLGPTHLLLSKLDETPRLEDSLVAALEGGLPLSYITTGQRVPEDLAAADGAELAAWLLGGR